jgi:hypothetical protein
VYGKQNSISLIFRHLFVDLSANEHERSGVPIFFSPSPLNHLNSPASSSRSHYNSTESMENSIATIGALIRSTIGSSMIGGGGRFLE